MTVSDRIFEISLRSIVFYFAATCCVFVVQNADAGPPRPRDNLREPVYRMAQAPPRPAREAARPASATVAVAVEENPLTQFIAKAKELAARMETGVKDYSATMVKRERIDGVLGDYEYINVKIRHEQSDDRGRVVAPFGVYLNFLAPDAVKGREVLYVKGRNDGKLTAHDGGTGIIAAIKSSVTVNLDPTAPMAMQGNKYPITDIGMKNLMYKLVVVAEEEKDQGEVEVKVFEGTKINGRTCTCIQSLHPVQRDHFRYHIARVYVDDELKLPIRYESYNWPDREGGKPVLVEEYTYLNVKINQGFTDRDFDRTNPNYRFN